MSAKNDFGVVVQPRFQWKGIGPMLAEMGWKVVPQPLKLPLLKRSARNIPQWVISSMVLTRVEALLRTLNRRFEVICTDLRAPKGSVDWNRYAHNSAVGRFDVVPCSYPDLRDDLEVKSAIRFTLEKHIRSLQTQTGSGSFVHRLLDVATKLVRTLEGIAPRLPSQAQIEKWLRQPLNSARYRDGIQAIEWTVDDYGLAGTAVLEGIPFSMSMSRFFEAWAETLFVTVARHTGGVLSTGRQRQTVRPIAWNRAFQGSQKALIPDLWLEWQDSTLIIDAKYKGHFMDLQQTGWRSAEERLRDEHREDLFQVLAYSALAATAKVAACLIYPCSLDFWRDLKDRQQLFHTAHISAPHRDLQLWLTAVPMAAAAHEVVLPLIQQVRSFNGA